MKVVLARYGAADYVVPDFSTKENAQQVIGLPYRKLVDEKNHFLKSLREEWLREAAKGDYYDPKSREGIEFKTSYN